MGAPRARLAICKLMATQALPSRKLTDRLKSAGFGLMIAAAGFVTGLGAMGNAASPAMAKDLVIGINQYPATLHPNIESMLAKSYVTGFAIRPLTSYDSDWKLVCMLCTELPSFENGKAVRVKQDGVDAVALTYQLKDDLFWADGIAVTTDDVLFTVDAGRHPLSGITNSQLYKRILKLEVKDKKTFTLIMDKVTFDYNALNDLRLLPAHVERPRFTTPAQYRTNTAFEQDPTNPGLWNGPYRVAALTQGAQVTLERNPYWKGHAPSFDRIIIRTIENTASLEANLLSGGINMIAGELGLPLEQAIAFEKRHGKKWQIIYKPSLVYEHFDVNLSSPILGDLRVRQALMYGMDRETISRQLFGGRQQVAHTSVNPLDGVYFPDVPKYAYNPKKAAALLDEAGWKMVGKQRQNAKGEVLSLELATTAGNRSREMVAQVLQAQWKKLGIDIRIKPEPARVFFGERVTRRNFPHLALFAWYSAPENVPRSVLHSEQIPTAENNWVGQNYTGYTSAAMDQLIDKIEQETNPDSRKPLWAELQKLYAQDLPALPLFFRSDAFILPRTMKGLVPTGHQDISPLWAEYWTN